MIEKLIDSDFYIHYPMIKLKTSTISACIPLITHLYDKLNIILQSCIDSIGGQR